jgi:hypothetical protein
MLADTAAISRVTAARSEEEGLGGLLLLLSPACAYTARGVCIGQDARVTFSKMQEATKHTATNNPGPEMCVPPLCLVGCDYKRAYAHGMIHTTWEVHTGSAMLWRTQGMDQHTRAPWKDKAVVCGTSYCIWP